MQPIFSTTFKEFNLLKHPFYLAWNEGKLTKDQLALYAGEYGAFIRLIPKGWEKLGESGIAAEETGHYLLWQDFAHSIGAGPIAAELSEVQGLVRKTDIHYQTYAGALGALYAFEKQQPDTVASKLQGLRKHYNHWGADETYFRVHEHDMEEPALLEEKIGYYRKCQMHIGIEFVEK
jgi:pyrroloquinoline-quinone synthase